MATITEVKYFNSFWIKKVVPKQAQPTPQGIVTAPDWSTREISGYWPGLPWDVTAINPDSGTSVSYPAFPWANAPTVTQTWAALPGVVQEAEIPVTAQPHWYLEESTHKGGFNNNRCSLGVRAYVVLENPQGVYRTQSLIHSGLLNTRTGYNETNVFSVSENIEKDMEAINGSIQKLYTEDTNLTVFQEAKINKVLINKNVLYSGTQGSAETGLPPTFFGQADAYAGEYGISKNPESFAVFGYRKYFSDRDRGVVCRLSMDGITEISDYGMTDYFRDRLASISSYGKTATNTITNVEWAYSASTTEHITITFSEDDLCRYSQCLIAKGSKLEFEGIIRYVSDIVTDGGNPATFTITLDSPIIGTALPSSFSMNVTNYLKDRIIGGWDVYNKNYTISTQVAPTTIYDNVECDDSLWDYATLNFDENVRGWVSFYSYRPLFIASMKNYFYSFTETNLYQHYVGAPTVVDNYGRFYGELPAVSSVSFIFNPNPNITKNFKTISYEGSNGWMMESALTDYQEVDRTNPQALPPTPFTYGTNYTDRALEVKSVDEGIYIDSFGYPANAGFTLKENRYTADLVNDNVNPRPGEVIYPQEIYPTNYASGDGVLTGIKGYVVNVKLQSDTTTQPGGRKELFSVASNYVVSST